MVNENKALNENLVKEKYTRDKLSKFVATNCATTLLSCLEQLKTRIVFVKSSISARILFGFIFPVGSL